MTTSKVGLKNGHIRKMFTQNGEPQSYSWGTQKKKKYRLLSATQTVTDTHVHVPTMQCLNELGVTRRFGLVVPRGSSATNSDRAEIAVLFMTETINRQRREGGGGGEGVGERVRSHMEKTPEDELQK